MYRDRLEYMADQIGSVKHIVTMIFTNQGSSLYVLDWPSLYTSVRLTLHGLVTHLPVSQGHPGRFTIPNMFLVLHLIHRSTRRTHPPTYPPRSPTPLVPLPSFAHAILSNAFPIVNAAATIQRYRDSYLTGCHPTSARYVSQNASFVPPSRPGVYATYRPVMATSNERRPSDGSFLLEFYMASWSLVRIAEFISLSALRGLSRGTHLL